jgi:hypothetical protein
MTWLPVMTLSDGTTVEMPMPASKGTGRANAHGYRVRGKEGILEFATLPEVLDHLSTRTTGKPADPTRTTSEGTAPVRPRIQPLRADPSGRGSLPSAVRRDP